MASRRFSRFRHALRLVASVFLLSTPCQGEDPAQAESLVALSVPAGSAAVPPMGPGLHIFAGAFHPVR